eukprot:TRINITY_DN12595_c0_g1_i3.p1 TRINITY_DN12595_c0_g1~~TRINITY_DN12595_c0_g1_i3.p1  ORF type:complete len:197 (-),score=14.14 TRINITY_DN12595_c0_g1_i3:15-584(-)
MRVLAVFGKICTMDEANPLVSAFIATDGIISFVGDEHEVHGRITSLRAAGTEVEELHAPVGGIVIPGFTDAHLHPLGSGLRLTACCDLERPGSLEVAVDRMAQYINSRPGRPYYIGYNVTDALFAKAHFHMLDGLNTTSPVLIKDVTGHYLWVNKAALDRVSHEIDRRDQQVLLDDHGAILGMLKRKVP